MFPFPFSKGGLPKWLNQTYFNNDIQKFVQDVVKQSISSSFENTKMMDTLDIVDEEEQQTPKNERLNVTIFESHDHVYVKMLIHDDHDVANLKIFHNSNQLTIEGIPSKVDRHVITLPSIVEMKDSASAYQDHYLQIKMRKKIDPQFTEVAVPPIE